MLPLLSPKIHLGLGATYAAMALVKGKRIIQSEYLRFDRAIEKPWVAGIHAFNDWFNRQEMDAENIKTSVYLSSELAPFALFPWQAESTDKVSQIGLAREYFNKVYGDLGEDREVVVSFTGFEQPWLASSIDMRLIEHFNNQLPQLALKRLQPLGVSMLRERKIKASTYWLIVPEPQKMVAVYVNDQAPSLVRSLPIQALAGFSLKAILERELRLSGQLSVDCEIYSTAKIEGMQSLLVSDWEINTHDLKFPVHLIGDPR